MNNDKIAILIKKASLEFDKISNPIFSEYNITASQYRVLKFLYSDPSKASRVVDIEKQCSITHPTALGLIEKLEKTGFVKKAVNPDDARSKVIILTDMAKDIQPELEGVGERIENILTKNLNADEKKQMVRLLNKLLNTESTGD